MLEELLHKVCSVARGDDVSHHQFEVEYSHVRHIRLIDQLVVAAHPTMDPLS